MVARSTHLASAVLAITALALGVEPAKKPFVDPAPPVASQLNDSPAPSAETQVGLTSHAQPGSPVPGAVESDWPCFLGPDHNDSSRETKLLNDLAAHPPKLLWELKKGEGYAAPAVADGRLILFHRVADQEAIDCLDAISGKRFWRFTYSTNYEDRYGYCNGPRSSPAIADGLVFAIGAEGKVHCLSLRTGQLLWERDLLHEFKLSQNFFGVGASPLVDGHLLIVNVGAPGGPCVAAFDTQSGRMVWGAGDRWGPSYATPVPAVLHGKRRVLVFAGGESRPPTGGLLCIDPVDGAVDFTFPWRGKRAESVNASSPVVIGDNVFVSECYRSGGVLLNIGDDLTCKPIWTNPAFGTHFMNAVLKKGYLYGVDGHGPEDADLVCVRLTDGKEIWRAHPRWTETVATGDGSPAREVPMGLDRCTLIDFPAEARCLCLGEYGHLLWLDLNPAGYKELSRTWLFAASDTWTPPVVSHGLLYVCQNQPGLIRGEPPRLLCYDMRGN